jgi:hypothetical protein
MRGLRLALRVLPCVLIAALLGAPSSQGATQTVDVYPIAGTTTANPATQISFRGATHLRSFSVVGSKSGRHRGHFAKHSDGRGVSFLPKRRFRYGEVVTVRSSTKLTGAGRDGAVRFRILTPLAPADRKHVGGDVSPDPAGSPSGVERFLTRPHLKPPGLGIITRDSGSSGDDIFLAPKAGPGQDGPMIRDARGRLIWFRPVKPPLSAYDFRTQDYLGRRVLSWWQGRVVNGKGRGYGLILDSAYQRIRKVKAGNGFHMDQHEFEITPNGTAYIIASEPVSYSLKPIGGDRNGIVWDSVVQEIDLRTGLVLFEWHSLAHVSVKLCVFSAPHGRHAYDPFHANSVSVEGSDRLLLSSRNTNALFEIDRHTGRVIWRLGGKRSTLKTSPDAAMTGQHTATRQRDGTITVFDTGGPDHAARGLRFRVDPRASTASLLAQYPHPGKPLFTPSQGSIQLLPSSDLFLSWGGGQPYLTELTPAGHTVFEASILPAGDDTYRAYRLPWTGARPRGKPAVAATNGTAGTSVYASWNGATDIATWEVMAGHARQALTPAATSPWNDFETRIQVPGPPPKFLSVRALDGAGHVLGTSRTISP